MSVCLSFWLIVYNIQFVKFFIIYNCDVLPFWFCNVSCRLFFSGLMLKYNVIKNIYIGCVD